MSEKSELRKEYKAEHMAVVEEYKQRRRRERRCFWTWPFGHVRRNPFTPCVICGHRDVF